MKNLIKIKLQLFKLQSFLAFFLLMGFFTFSATKSFAQISSKIAFNYDESIIYMGSERYGFTGNGSFRFGHGSTDPSSINWKEVLRIDYGGLRLFDENIYLRGANDYNHGLKYAGSNFFPVPANTVVDGPVLFGWDGGALASTNHQYPQIALRWTAAGNVGIGTNNPSNKFDLVGAARTGTHATNLPFYATGDVGENSNGFEFRHSNGTAGIGFGWRTIYATGTNGNNSIALASQGTGGIFFNTNGTTRMTIDGSGNIGINGNAALEFGAGVTPKQSDAGKIGYQTFTTGALDIVGAGTEGTNRKIKLWSEGGLEVAGSVRIGDKDLYLRGGADTYHGLGWYGLGKLFAGANVDGPVLFGNSGGALGTTHGGTNLIALNWNANGNVGIGTASPTQKLEVNGNLKLTGVDFMLDNTDRRDGATGAYRRALVHDGSDVLTINYANDYTGGVNIGQNIYFAPDPTDASKLKLGIGTTPTKGKLHVRGSVNVENDLGTQVFHVAAQKQLVFVGDSAYIQHERSQSNSQSPIQQNNFSMWVSKGIVTQDIAIVDPADWSDFVFAKDYNLRSLEEVSAYIAAHGHLPEMPSEAEVKAQGYSVHDINKKLLQKIEELTLYTIQQEEKLKAQEKQFTDLEQRIKQLEANK
ncbi:MAG TPA: hypothetical protein PKC76_00965 [Saprospiraceae bacterium]|nr:hypothetical protein [Saprospiraceae bacterium]HMP22664.1 hypothetical protein [Saprospiraceae bacterium]